MAYADENIDIAAIYTESPEVSALTDEDSGDDDVNGDLDRLTGRQLRAPVEIQQRNNIRINSDAIEQNTNSDADRIEPLPKEKQMEFTWISGDLQSRSTEFHFPDYSEFSNRTPVVIFEMFWGDDVVEYLVQETRKYALFKNATHPNITAEELKCALAILILSGYDVKPVRRYYWDSKPHMGNEMIKKSMRKNRFEQMMQFLHVADNNNPDMNDEGWKIRPLMDN
ncbi:hypothetical protein JTB14_004104 [Gonioctena quinquepunctata]|nr:hypothetical protein JTB14_004104 [Gonioctena quinquepunctata]